MNKYYLGNTIVVSAEFEDDDDAVIDPTAVFLTVKTTTETTYTYTTATTSVIVKDTTGNYHANLVATVEGEWHIKWHSTGTGAAAVEDLFFIYKSEFS